MHNKSPLQLLAVLSTHAWIYALGSVYAQTLHTLESTHGTEVKAVIKSYDPSTGNVELLVPKTVPFASLTPLSQSTILSVSGVNKSKASLLSAGDGKCPVSGYDRISDFPKNYLGLVLYTQGAAVRGVEDFAWFSTPMSKIQNGGLSLSIGTEAIPSGERVTLQQRAIHPRSGAWIFQVRWRTKKLWVLADSLGKERNSLRDAVMKATKQKDAQPPVLTGGEPNDIKFAFSLYAEPILAFSSSERLNTHFKEGWIYPANASESKQIGALTLSPNTKLRVLKRIQPAEGLNHYLVEPLEGVAIGEQLYVHPDDICDRPQ